MGLIKLAIPALIVLLILLFAHLVFNLVTKKKPEPPLQIPQHKRTLQQMIESIRKLSAQVQPQSAAEQANKIRILIEEILKNTSTATLAGRFETYYLPLTVETLTKLADKEKAHDPLPLLQILDNLTTVYEKQMQKLIRRTTMTAEAELQALKNIMALDGHAESSMSAHKIVEEIKRQRADE